MPTIAQAKHGHKRAGRPRKNSALHPRLPSRWARRSEFHEWLGQLAEELQGDLIEQHRELFDKWRAEGGGKSLRAHLRGDARPTTQCEASIANQVRMIVDLGLIGDDELELGDLPEDLPRELLDQDGVTILIRGIPERLPLFQFYQGRYWDWADVSNVEVWIVSPRDQLALMLKPQVTGRKVPYYTVDRQRIRKDLPQLGAMLWRNGLYYNKKAPDRDSTGQMTTFARIVLAAAGVDVAGLDSHHTPAASGTCNAGFTTMDNRIEVIQAICPELHRQLHIASNDGHFYA